MSKLLQNSVRRTLFQMAFPMLAGTVAMHSYNLADTWYVSRLRPGQPLRQQGRGRGLRRRPESKAPLTAAPGLNCRSPITEY